MSESTIEPDNGAPGGAEEMRPGDVGYASLWVPDVERAEAFYGAVLGWTFAPGSVPQGRQVAGTEPHHGIWGGQARSTLFLCHAVDDVDEAVARVRAAGGDAEEPSDEPYGRVATCADDQGMPFAVFEPPTGPPPRGAPHGRRQGDLAYITLLVRDSALARAFFAAVLGWSFVSGRVADGWQTDGVRPGTGLQGGHAEATVVPMYLVDDIAAAVARARVAGGVASDPERQPYGLQSTCTDDQGTRFYLGEL